MRRPSTILHWVLEHMREGGIRTLGAHSATIRVRRGGGLLDQAEAVLRRSLAANPHNAKVLLRLGDVLRGKGSFPAALDAYRRLCTLQPDNAKALWPSAILSGDRLPSAAPAGRRAAPFVRLMDFLPQPEQERLFKLTLAGSQRFFRAGVGDFGHVNLETRTAWHAHTQTVREVRPLVVPRLRRILPCVLARLGMESLERHRIELHVTVHLAGGYYRPHSDNSSHFHHPRKITYVYYFHREPKRFSGGDLLLYDTDLETGSFDCNFFSRIKPHHNSLVMFPSSYVHEITPVEGDSQDFADGRFTVNGWVRSRGESGAGGATA